MGMIIKATTVVDMLPELCRTGNAGEAAAVQEKLKEIGKDADFQARLQSLKAAECLPDPQPVKLAVQGVAPPATTLRDDASGWLTKSLGAARQSVRTQNETMLEAVAKDQALKDDRARDRLADALTRFAGARTCVAIVQYGREIGVFANKPDDLMRKDVEDLLGISRATGHEAEKRYKAFLAEMKRRRGRDFETRELKRIQKTIAFLRDLERQHQRLRVVGYNGALPVVGWNEQEVHAE